MYKLNLWHSLASNSGYFLCLFELMTSIGCSYCRKSMKQKIVCVKQWLQRKWRRPGILKLEIGVNDTQFFVHWEDISTFSSKFWNLVILSNNLATICRNSGGSLWWKTAIDHLLKCKGARHLLGIVLRVHLVPWVLKSDTDFRLNTGLFHWITGDPANQLWTPH